jgi:hypothetical protein
MLTKDEARRIAVNKAGLGHLALLDLASGSLQPIQTEFTEFGSVRASGNRVVFRGGASVRPTSIVALDLPSGQCRVLKQATDLLNRTELGIADYLTKVESAEFPTTAEKTAFGLFYPPRNPDYAGSADERPPLLVKCHGGPTSSASSTLTRNAVLDEPRHHGWRCSVLLFGERGGSPFEQDYEEQAQSYQIMEGAAAQAAQAENKASFGADLGAGIQGLSAGFKIASAMALL